MSKGLDSLLLKPAPSTLFPIPVNYMLFSQVLKKKEEEEKKEKEKKKVKIQGGS